MSMHHAKFHILLLAASLFVGSGLAPTSTYAAAAADPARKEAVGPSAQSTLIITHPVDYVLRNYVTLVRQHVLDVKSLRIIGVYHAQETEDYAAAQAYLAKEHIDWIELKPIDCDVTSENVYGHNNCRAAIEPVLARASAIVFNGGDDIPPYLYNQSTLLTTQVETPMRHAFETAILVQMMGSTRAPEVVPLLAKRPDFTVLGICVGMQTMNVAAGGNLVQDIPSQIYHQQSVETALGASPATWHRNHTHERGTHGNVAVGVMHPIHVLPTAPPFMFTADPRGHQEPMVLSIHHQAVDKVGAGYVVYATSDDGKIIEAIGRHDFPNVLGLQFHPERSAMWKASEMQQMSAMSTQHNFVFDAMAKDPHTKALNEGVWMWLADHMSHPTTPSAHKS